MMSKIRYWPVATVMVCAGALGVVMWGFHFGAGGIALASGVGGIALAQRRLGFPRALAMIVIWSLACWFLVASITKAVPFGAVVPQVFLMTAAFAPLLIGAVLASVSQSGQSRRDLNVPMATSSYFAASVGGVALVAAAAIALVRYGFAGIAWTMSGDMRNHIDSFQRAYPENFSGTGIYVDPISGFHGVMAVLASAPDRASIPYIELLHLNLVALFTVTILAGILSSYANVALLLQAMPAPSMVQPWAIAGASVVALTGAGIGIGLLDGFITALLVIPILTLTLVVGMAAAANTRYCQQNRLELVTASLATVLMLFIWSYVAIAGLAVVIIIAAMSWKQWRKMTRVVVVVIGTLAAIAAYATLPAWADGVLSSGGLSMFGTISSLNPLLLLVLPLIVTAAMISQGSRMAYRKMFPYFGVIGTCSFVVAFMVFQPIGEPVWTYYAAKVTWILVASTVALVFVAFATAPSGVLRVGRPKWVSGVANVSGVIGILLVIRLLSPADSPVATFELVPPSYSSQIADGWVNPNAATVDVMFAAMTLKEPVVIWAVIDAANDRLGNFWVLLDPSTRELNGRDDLRGWAYYADGNIATLCTLLQRYPQRIVVTRDTALENVIRSQCRISNPRIHVLP